jgi:hypothetical protein
VESVSAVPARSFHVDHLMQLLLFVLMSVLQLQSVLQ